MNKAVRKLGQLLTIMCVCIIMTGCGKSLDYLDTYLSDYSDDYEQNEEAEAKVKEEKIKNNSSGNSEGDTWSIFMYFCGTNLESDAQMGGACSYNLYEILCADHSDNVNIVIQTGGAEAWQTEEYGLDMDVDADKIQRWSVNDEEIELVDEQRLSSMGNVKTLEAFLDWGITEYPADKYMIVFWNHGGGPGGGIAYDELYNDECLKLNDVADALKSSGVKFEVVGFDACLMASIETAAAISPYANYMVASEEIEPGGGWDYTAWLSYLAEDPTMGGDLLGIEICDSYMEKCESYGEEKLSTLSVTDLSKIPSLVSAFDKMSQEMKGYTGDVAVMKPLKSAFTKAECYGANNGGDGQSNLVDLGDLTLCAKGVISETGEEVLNSLIDAVTYHVAGDARKKGTGLSVYLPVNKDTEELNLYAQHSAISADYIRFMEGMTNWKAPKDILIQKPVVDENDELTTEEEDIETASEAESIEEDDYSVEYEVYVDDDGYFNLDLYKGGEIIILAKCNLYWYDEEYDEVLYLGSDYDVVINDDWTNYSDNFQNIWVYIEDQLVEMLAIDINDDYITYAVPVTVNGRETNLQMIYDIDKETYEVVGTWDGIDEESGYANRTQDKLKNGDEIEFVYQAIDLDSEEEYSYVAGGFTVNGKINVEEYEMGDGEYFYGFELVDLFGNSYESDYAYILVEDGEISVEFD